MTGMNKLMYLIMFVTVCIFVMLLPLMDYIPRNSWAVKLSDVPVFAPPPAQEKTRIIFTSRVAETAKQESDLESHIRVPITWTKEQTVVNILTGAHAGINNFRSNNSSPYLYTLSHLDGYATLSNVPENLGFLNRLAKGEKLEITFAEEVTELKPGDLALEINHGAVNLYGLVLVKEKLPAKTSVRMQVYDVMPLVANLAGTPYPPGCIGSVPWEIFPFDMELKAYRNFFLLRQKLVLADGFSTYLFGTSNLSDIDSYKPGISYYQGEYEKTFKEEQEMITQAMNQIDSTARKKWLLDLSQRWYWFVLGALFLVWRFNVRMIPVSIGLMLLSALLGGFLFKFTPLFLIGPALATVPIALLFPDMDTESIFYMSAAVVLIWMGLFGARRTLIVTSSLSMYILWSSFSVALIAGAFTVVRRWQDIWS